MTQQKPGSEGKLPKWFVYGLAAKMAFLAAVVLFVLWWAGIFR